MFDNSDYDNKSKYYFDNNKKVIGKMKDEAAGIPITEFVGLRSKMYSYMKDNQKGGKTAKGVKKNIIKKKYNSFQLQRYIIQQQADDAQDENYQK